MEALLFGALISATDPVAVMSIFHVRPVDANLHAVIFGESLLNDAASLVMFETIMHFIGKPFGVEHVLEACADFLIIFIGSVAIGSLRCFARLPSFCISHSTFPPRDSFVGTLTALAATLFFKHVGVKAYPTVEVTLFFVMSLSPYFIAQGLGLSGVVATLFAGIVMAHYTSYNISKSNRLLTRQLYHLGRTIAETFLFLYLGIEIIIYEHEFQFDLIIAAIVVVLAARAVHVWPLLGVANCKRAASERFDGRKKFVVWLCGLHGAVAFALAVLADKYRPPVANAGRIVTSTLATCVFTMFVCGIGVYYCVDKLGLVVGGGGGGHGGAHALANGGGGGGGGGGASGADDGTAARIGRADERIETQSSHEMGRFLYWDRRYFKPFFTNKSITGVGGPHMDGVERSGGAAAGGGGPVVVSLSESARHPGDELDYG